MRRSNHENIDVLMLIGLVTGEEGEGGEGKSHSKVGTRWVRQKTPLEPNSLIPSFLSLLSNPGLQLALLSLISDLKFTFLNNDAQ